MNVEDKLTLVALDVAELHALLRTMGIALTPLEIEIFMRKMAPQANSGINFSGFVDLMLKLRDQRSHIEEGKLSNQIPLI